MNTRIRLAALLLWTVTSASRAVIVDFKQLDVDFTKSADATNKTTWHPATLNVSAGGLGWDGNAASSRAGWIQTKAFALGLSWRPTSAVALRVNIQPAPRETTLPNGQKTTPYVGDVYVRYSPDLAHWSSWQALSAVEAKLSDAKTKPGRNWTGTVRVPYRDRDEYGKLLTEYSTLDVPWKSDEEAAVQWILGRDPEFFARHLPFIGYVQFLFEGDFNGGQRLRSFSADFSYAMSGLHSPPKDPKASQSAERTQWKFRAVTGPNGPALEELIPNAK